MPRGTVPATTPGDCPTCGRAKVWKADSRRATLGYWTCAHRDVVKRTARPATPRPPRARRHVQGTQEWMSNPSVAACKTDGCFWDGVTCPRHAARKKN
jgi:hypothetical protein